MKTNYLKVALAVSLTFVTCTVQSQTLREIESASARVNEIYAELRLDQIQADSHSLVTEIHQEVLEARETKNTDIRGQIGIFALLSFIHIGGNAQTSERIDHTVVIDANRRQVLTQENRASKNAVLLQVRLNDLLTGHLRELVTMKIAAVAEAQAALAASANGQTVAWDLVKKDLAKSLVANFVGRDRVVRCVQIRHIPSMNEVSDHEKVGGSFGFLLSFIGASASHSYDGKTEHFAYNEESCRTAERQVTADRASSPNAIDLSRLDGVLEGWQLAIERAAAFNPSIVPMPYWGSPYAQ